MEWLISPKHKKPISVEMLAKIMGCAASTIWSNTNPNLKQTPGPKFWFAINKATKGAIKRSNYYPKGK